MSVLSGNMVSNKRNFKRKGSGLVNSLINKLPFELHLPSYQYCGPGTKLEKRLARGDTGINPLDQACREHDISYSKSKDLKSRHQADEVLQNAALKRLRSSDSSLGEKTAALVVSGAMKAKRTLGMGVRRRRYNLRKRIIGKGTINRSLTSKKKNVGKGPRKRKTRVIKTPKIGGFIFTIPAILGALGALGSLGGGAAAIAKAVNDSKSNQKNLEETRRHNQAMETLAAGKGIYLPLKKNIRHKGLYLKPFKRGLGLYLNPRSKNYQ